MRLGDRAGDGELDVRYHDEEWGVPVCEDLLLFEMLTLEGAQAGLSWSTILKKREGYRRAFAGFDIERVARFNEADVERLVNESSIVRHRGKIESVVTNARASLAAIERWGSLSDCLWRFVEGEPIVNRWTRDADVPATSPESHAMSKGLKKEGFAFVGPTTCYAFMQAVGMVNDHITSCFRCRWEACDRG